MSKFYSKNFTRKELDCRCGCGFGPQPELIQALQQLRDKLGFPLHINSCARCEKHNKKIGGSPNSQHVKGLAVDISTICLSGAQISNLRAFASELGFRGIGRYDRFLHIDLRPSEAIWDNCSKSS